MSTLRATTDPDTTPVLNYRILDRAGLRSLPAPSWIIKHVLPANALGVLYGSWGTGKSFLALDLALHILLGWPWNGHRIVAPGTPLYIAAEDESSVDDRITAWELAHELTPGSLNLPTVAQEVPLTRPAHIAQLILDIRAQLAGAHPNLIIFDTLARSLGGENGDDNQTMTLAVQQAETLRRAFDCTVLLIHHPGWSGGHMRGASSLPAGVGTILRLEPIDELDDTLVKLHCEKQRNGAKFSDKHFRRETIDLGRVDEDGDAITSCFMTPSAIAPIESSGEKRLNEEYRALLTLLADRPEGLRSADWIALSGSSEATYQRYRKVCEQRDWIYRDGRNYRLTDRGRAWLDGKEYAPPTQVELGTCPETGFPHEYAAMRDAFGHLICVHCQTPRP